MPGLGSYRGGGRMLFLGLGTGLGSAPQKQHAPIATITAECLHGCVDNDAHRYSQRPRKIKVDPILTQVLRGSKNSSVAYRRRKTNRRNVEFPATHGLIKVGMKLFWMR